MPARAFRHRVSIFYAFLYLGLGVQLPFLPLWLAEKGLDSNQIAITLAAFIAVRIIAAPLSAFLADRSGNPVVYIRACSALCSGAFGVMGFMDGFWAILIAGLVASAFLAPVVPLVESFAMEGSQQLGLDYGRMRLWGSVSFIAGSIGSGLALEVVPTGWVAFLLAGAQGLLALASLVLPRRLPVAAHEQTKAAKLGDLGRLIGSNRFVLFVVAVSIAQASHALLYSFGSVHWDSLGYSKAVIGSLWSIGIAAEVTLFAFSSMASRRMSAEILILAGCLGGLVRWVITAGDPALWLLIPVQALHALSFALTHLGTMLYIQRSVPAGLRNSAQGVYTAMSGGVAMMIATWASGLIYPAMGGRAYLVMAAMSLIAVLLALALRRISPTTPEARDA